MRIKKRNGTYAEYDPQKIEQAIRKANKEVENPEDKIDDAFIEETKACIEEELQTGNIMDVEEIQNMIIDRIIKHGKTELAEKYITYRYKRTLVRQSNTTDEQILTLLECENDEIKTENSNKNPTVVSVQRDYMAGEVSKDITNRFLLPPEIVKAHKSGRIHFHDADYFAQHMHNCDLVDFAGMVNYKSGKENNGVVTALSGHGITTPTTLRTAANLLTQGVAQIASSQYGGQTFTMTDLVGGRHKDDVNFVQLSRDKIRKSKIENFKELGIKCDEEQLAALVEKELMKEIKDSIQLIQYQLITLQTTNGQAPFVSVFMYLNECKEEDKKKDLVLLIQAMLEQRIKGVQNKQGVWITPAFPKLLYVLEDDNHCEGTKYWELTKLAAKCTAKRMVPDYISEKIMLEEKGDCYPCMGCRSFLTEDSKGLGEDGEHKYYGRFNQGVVTINLVDVACASYKNEDEFWKIFEESMEEYVHVSLRIRHERLKGTKSDVAPILWQDGALARLKPGETIDKLLYDNYSTLSIGYAGLAECVRYMKGVSHTNTEGHDFAIRVMQFLNNKAALWRAQENISYSVYGTPLESTTYKFAKCLKENWGIIPGVTDKDYITNSYHIHVTEKIDAFTKLTRESEFQKLSPGGAISYVEVPNMQDNIEGVLAIMEHIYQNIMYAELNTKSDYCQVCGFDGEIQMIEDKAHKKMIWKCPNCGNTDQDKMNVARRTCGYIGTQFWNFGRSEEIFDRQLHVSNDMM